MQSSRPGTSKQHPGGDGHREPLYGPDELEVLGEELMTAYSTVREKMITRDEVVEIKKNQFAVKENRRLSIKQAKEDDISMQLRAKQEALMRLYDNVIKEKKKKEKGKKGRKHSTGSGGSFHEMYAVYHDPTNAARYELERGVTGSAKASLTEMKILETTIKPEPEPEPEKQNVDPKTGKQRSMFVIKKDDSYERPKSLSKRFDTRYSETNNRFSFDVDVKGPFQIPIDPNRSLVVKRTVGTQSYISPADLAGITVAVSEMHSQTEIEMTDWDPNRYSLTSERLGGDGGIRSLESEDDETLGAGDASSSNPSSEKEELTHAEDNDEEFEGSGKLLERKESKRREAEVSARPRGYRDMNLNVQMPFVTFEAETSVTAFDLEKEMAKQRGFVLTRDNILWPTCDQFDMDIAARKIEDYIKRCWQLDSKWLFYIKPLEVYNDNYRKKYVFEVKFSVPSPATPVPPATASVFFVFEIPLYAAKNDKVKISYVLEGTRFAHKPGSIPFQDKWLWNIITDKLRVQKAVNF